jgi:hypothetical protein
MQFDGVYRIVVCTLYCSAKVPKMWENSPVLQFSVFCVLIPTYEVGVKIVVMCFNSCYL